MSSRKTSTAGRLDSNWNNTHSFQEIDERSSVGVCCVFREMKETGSTNPIGRFRMTTKPFRGIHSCREGVLVSKWLHYCEWMSMNECYH